MDSDFAPSCQSVGCPIYMHLHPVSHCTCQASETRMSVGRCRFPLLRYLPSLASVYSYRTAVTLPNSCNCSTKNIRVDSSNTRESTGWEPRAVEARHMTTTLHFYDPKKLSLPPRQGVVNKTFDLNDDNSTDRPAPRQDFIALNSFLQSH